MRRIVGGLFVIYGIILSVAGAFDGGTEVTKAQGIRINLWAGLAMLTFGLLFLAWQWARPAKAPTRDSDATTPSESPSE